MRALPSWHWNGMRMAASTALTIGGGQQRVDEPLAPPERPSALG